jgi:hypothetical protein
MALLVDQCIMILRPPVRLAHSVGRQTLLGKGANLAWRKHLAGADSPNFPATLKPFQFDFPHVLYHPPISGNDLKTVGSQFKRGLLSAVEEYKAVLIRGLPVKTGEDFALFYSGLELKSMAYLGGVSKGRDSVKGDVFLSSRDPPEFTIEPHQEMSYSKNYPDLVSTVEFDCHSSDCNLRLLL